MPRSTKNLRTILPASLLLLLAASTGHAASYSGPLNKGEWATDVPSYIDMFIAVPDTMPEKPPILVNIHSCGNNAGGQWSYDGFAPLRAAIDAVGFIMILPQQSRNCWNVGAPESLTHDGGGDTGAIVQMVKYALEKYNGDPNRVYVMGGSGGGMTTQALLAVYPGVFKAGHARAGVPAGCWAEGYDDGQQWSGSCATGSVDKTAEEWGNYVRQINPSHTGPRPRIQLNHGNNDETINFNNFREAIEQWTNVLGLDATPTSTDSGFQGTAKPSSGSPPVTYDRQFWKDDCGYTVLEAWEALNEKHGMGYEAEAILQWFGLDAVREQDPWDAACGGMGETDPDPGSGGMDSDAGGPTGTDATGTDTGATGTDTGATGTATGATGAATGATGAAPGATGAAPGATGAAPGATGAAPGATGAAPGATGAAPGATGVGPIGSTPPPVAPVTPGTVPTPAPSGAVAPSGTVDPVAPAGSGAPAPSSDRSDSGCSVVAGSSTGGALPVVLLGLSLLLYRRRNPRCGATVSKLVR